MHNRACDSLFPGRRRSRHHVQGQTHEPPGQRLLCTSSTVRREEEAIRLRTCGQRVELHTDLSVPHTCFTRVIESVTHNTNHGLLLVRSRAQVAHQCVRDVSYTTRTSCSGKSPSFLATFHRGLLTCPTRAPESTGFNRRTR